MRRLFQVIMEVKDQTYIAFGLGSIINQATSKGNFPLLVAGVLAMAVSVVLINRLFWKRLFLAGGTQVCDEPLGLGECMTTMTGHALCQAENISVGVWHG